jgi:hypothetical protein
MKNRSKTKSLVAAFVLYAATLSTVAMAHSSLVVWIAPSLHRVGMAEPAGSGTQVSLSGARNGYQSFQIVVSGASDSLSNVNVRISDLEGPRGEVIPRTSLACIGRSTFM